MMSKFPAKGYTDAWEVESLSTPGKIYTVSRRASGIFACDCPKWKFSHAPKPDCKHISTIKLARERIGQVVADRGVRVATAAELAVGVPVSPVSVSLDGVFVGVVSATVAQQIRALIGVGSKPVAATAPEVTTVGDFRIRRKFRFDEATA